MAFVVAILAATHGVTPGVSRPTLFNPIDFVEYWSAARVHLRGGDPYDGHQILPWQREANGNPDQVQATMLWTPPWTLPLYWPFGMLPILWGHLAWVWTQAACVGVSTFWVWRVYGGSGWMVPLGAAIFFAPCWWMIGFGQNTGLPLIGVAGFLYFRVRGQPRWAGVCAALTAVKPHLLLVFGLALVLDGTTRAGRQSLLASLGVVLFLAILSLVPDPDVYSDYRASMTRPQSDVSVPLSQWQVPTISYRLRVQVEHAIGTQPGTSYFWVQFIPAALGGVALLPYWWLRRSVWDWRVETPRLVLISVILAPYGAWIFDLTVLLVPVLAAAAALFHAGRFLPTVSLAAGFGCASVLTMNSHFVQALHEMIWFAPAMLILIVLSGWVSPRSPT
ncbi:MAG: DUF2029 domain-containing protein [Bacteroidales bacterium]|nr:DUF2029 domain-containing protein [Bacteroidales bacterium]